MFESGYLYEIITNFLYERRYSYLISILLNYEYLYNRRDCTNY